MRLPFSLRKVPEPSDSSSRRSSITENTSNDQATQAVPDDLSEHSTVHSNSTPIDTPATSYSSYNSVYDREARKTGMYKLSVVDNSGTFLPPSPPDNSGSRAWSLHRKRNSKSRERVASLDGPFIIARESFEGYRRSFDIGGTSPTLGSASPTFGTPRLSLDSNICIRNSSISSPGTKLHVSNVPKVEEGIVSEAPFEDVKLDDEDKISRRTILSRFGFGHRMNMPKKRDGEELQSFEMED